MFLFEAKRIAIVIVGAFINAIALNFFYISADVYAGGFTGMAQLLASFFATQLDITFITTGIWLVALNIPVIILGWFKVGRHFTIYSILSVAATTLFLELLPKSIQMPSLTSLKQQASLAFSEKIQINKK